jgi:hypothetical protein
MGFNGAAACWSAGLGREEKSQRDSRLEGGELGETEIYKYKHNYKPG